MTATGVLRRMRRPAIVLALLSALLVAGCSGGDHGHDDHSETYDGAIHGTHFDPTSLDMPRAHTLRFETHDSFKHTATESSRGLDSGDLTTNEGHEFHDMQPGTYVFTCKYHASMRVTVKVS